MSDYSGEIKRLFILRHAKSSWNNPGLKDFDRPLNSRGYRDAPYMAEKLQKMGYSVSSIYLSPSMRTRETSKPFIELFKVAGEHVHYVQSLYHGDPDQFLKEIHDFGEGDNNVMMIGHNPGITWLANLCDLPAPIDNIPTSGLLILEARIPSWQDFTYDEAHMKRFLYPKKFE